MAALPRGRLDVSKYPNGHEAIVGQLSWLVLGLQPDQPKPGNIAEEVGVMKHHGLRLDVDVISDDL